MGDPGGHVWRDHKEHKRILIGLTDGELAFADDRDAVIQPDRNALPEPLQELYEEEERYIDLRWARNAGGLAISHPRFRDAVAELAAPIHGKPKDELGSDEVRGHRRTVRLARGAAAAILTLFVLAIVAAVVALVQRNNAVNQAMIATSRQLAAVSQTQLGTNLDIALPLAARAYSTSPPSSIRLRATGVPARRSSSRRTDAMSRSQSSRSRGGLLPWFVWRPVERTAVAERQELDPSGGTAMPFDMSKALRAAIEAALESPSSQKESKASQTPHLSTGRAMLFGAGTLDRRTSGGQLARSRTR